VANQDIFDLHFAADHRSRLLFARTTGLAKDSDVQTGTPVGLF
jgi:hypothetical protein